MEKEKYPNIGYLRLYHIRKNVYERYKKEFRDKVYVNRELSEMMNAYMIECLQDIGIKIKL